MRGGGSYGMYRWGSNKMVILSQELYAGVRAAGNVYYVPAARNTIAGDIHE